MNLTIFSSMLAFFVVIRVTDSEGAYCDSNDLSCGGILPGIMITVTANNSAPIFENSFARLDENVGNIKHIIVNNSIATVLLASNYTKMSGQVHIYGVPNYQSIYNASINMFQNFTNEGSLNSINGESKMVLNAPPATPHSFPYFAGAGILDGIYYGGVVGIDVIGPLIARDPDMLCGDGSYESCTHSCVITHFRA